MRTQPIPLLRKDRMRNLRKKRIVYILIGIAAFFVLAIGLYFIPPIHERLSWRLVELRTRIVYWLNPPEEAVFVPTQQSQVDWIVTQTMSALLTPSETPIPSGEPTATPTITHTPMPLSVYLDVPVYAHQCFRWNYCGPANLTMALKFWGWNGTRDDVAAVIKPGVQNPNLDFVQQGFWDKNVMPYEMVDFINEHTNLRALYRIGGDIQLLKNMLVNGFPVIIEKGYYEFSYTGELAWMGHYSFVTGYNDASGGMIWQDTYPNACDDSDPAVIEEKGRDNLSPYPDFIQGWRGFDYVFIVVYPPERGEELQTLLGSWIDPNWAARYALGIANREIPSLAGNDLYFAWLNKGTSLVALGQYQEAAAAFDMAFQVYATLGGDNTQRPYRLLWYQDSPYAAYYYASRYQDVINLADVTFSTIDEDTIEETLYWRSLAKYALGNGDAAIHDMREAIRLNPNFKLAREQLSQWGVSP
jgi:hypothetical protein